jgi:hypothetical protein
MVAMKALVLAALLLGGCLLKPDRVDVRSDGGSADATRDGAPAGPFTVRVLHNAWYADMSTESQFMSNDHYGIASSGAAAGDLLLLIANIDNGDDTVFSVPAGFTQMFQHNYGQGLDGQTFAAFYKIATSAEPVVYAGPYDNSVASTSDAAALTLLAITGYASGNEINVARYDDNGTTNAGSPVSPLSFGVTTTQPGCLLIFAAGVDWSSNGAGSTAVFEPPTGFTMLSAFGDHGETAGIYDWTNLMTAWSTAPQQGPTGPITASIDSVPANAGSEWAATIAITPAPGR